MSVRLWKKVQKVLWKVEKFLSLESMKKERDFYQVSLKVFLKNNEGEVLILKVESGTFAGFYDLPGGRINIDEFKVDFIEILKREIEEEIGKINFHFNSNKPVALGRHLIPASFSDEGREKRVIYIFFEADFLDGDITISNEHAGYKWLDLKSVDPKQYFKSGILEGVKMYLTK